MHETTTNDLFYNLDDIRNLFFKADCDKNNGILMKNIQDLDVRVNNCEETNENTVRILIQNTNRLDNLITELKQFTGNCIRSPY